MNDLKLTIEIGPTLERLIRDLFNQNTRPQPEPTDEATGNGQMRKGLARRVELKKIRPLVDDLIKHTSKIRTDAEIAQKFGVSRSVVNVLQRLRLQRPDLLNEVIAGNCSIGNAEIRMHANQ